MARPGAREVGGEAGSAITCRWSANPIVGKFLKLPMCTAHAAATPTAPAATAAEPGTRPYGRAGNGAVEASRQRRRTAVELTRAFESAHTKRSTRNFGLGGQHVRRRRYSGRAPQAPISSETVDFLSERRPRAQPSWADLQLSPRAQLKRDRDFVLRRSESMIRSKLGKNTSR